MGKLKQNPDPAESLALVQSDGFRDVLVLLYTLVGPQKRNKRLIFTNKNAGAFPISDESRLPPPPPPRAKAPTGVE